MEHTDQGRKPIGRNRIVLRRQISITSATTRDEHFRKMSPNYPAFRAVWEIAALRSRNTVQSDAEDEGKSESKRKGERPVARKRLDEVVDPEVN